MRSLPTYNVGFRTLWQRFLPGSRYGVGGNVDGPESFYDLLNLPSDRVHLFGSDRILAV
jgi:hypothetical protein